MSEEQDIDCNNTNDINFSDGQKTIENTRIVSHDPIDNIDNAKLSFEVKKSELNPDANAYTANTSMFDPSYPSLSSIVESVYPSYNHDRQNTNAERKP